MVEYEVKNGASKTELSIKVKEPAQFDEFGYRMLRANKVEGIAAFGRSVQDEVAVYDYDVTGMISFEQQYEGKKIALLELKELYEKVLSILLKAEDYFLDQDSFLIGQQFIYFLAQKRSYELLYCPESKQEIKQQLADLTEYIMNHMEYQDQNAVTLVYEIFKMLRDGHSTLNEVLVYVQQGKRQPTPPPVANYQQPQNQMLGNLGPQEIYRNPKVQEKSVDDPSISKKESTEQTSNFSVKKLLFCSGVVIAGIASFLAAYLSGMLYISHTQKLDTTKAAGVGILISAIAIYACYRIYGMEEEKKKEGNQKALKGDTKKENQLPKQNIPVQNVNIPVMEAVPVMAEPLATEPLETESLTMQPMGSEPKEQYRLVDRRNKNGQQYIIYKTPYLIGKSAEQVDGIIYSDAVSKVHAQLIMEKGTLFIIDMSSTNGTYVNAKKLASNQRIAIHRGDKIQIADKQFELVS